MTQTGKRFHIHGCSFQNIGLTTWNMVKQSEGDWQNIFTFWFTKDIFRIVQKHTKQVGVVVIVLWLDLQLSVQSVPITTKAVSSNPGSWRGILDTTLCDKVCHWLATGRWFLRVLWFPPPIKLTVESGVKHHWSNQTKPCRQVYKQISQYCC